MFPRVTNESFSQVDDINIDDQKFKTFVLIPVPSPGSAPWKIGPKAQLFHPGIQHAIRLLSADVTIAAAAKPAEKCAWMWAHVIRKDEDEPVTIDKYVYASFEEAIFQTNIYLLKWVLKSSFMTLWIQGHFPCYIDDINHMFDFSQINPATVVLTDDWKAEDPEIKHAISDFERYISSGLFVKECCMLATLDLKKNPYKKRVKADFVQLAKIRLETFL